MILHLHTHIQPAAIESLRHRLEGMGLRVSPVTGGEAPALAVVGGLDGQVDAAAFAELPGVARVATDKTPNPLTARVGSGVTAVRVRDVVIGGADIVVMAGPCSVEDEAQVMACAETVARHGGGLLRGGAFKPRTSPYMFQGLGRRGLELLARAGAAFGLPTVTEVLDADDLGLVAEYADMLQIGARNMQNFSLLKKAGKTGRPVLLKRGPSATIQEFLLAAEYLLDAGNPHVVLCERGIRGFDTQTRNVLDLAAVPLLRQLSHLPVIADPSHGTGLRELVPPMARAAIAAGADGLMIEIHPNPEVALSDGRQSLTLEQYGGMVESLRPIASAVQRRLREARVPRKRRAVLLG